MTPWFVLQFVASPVSMVMHVTNRQKMMLLLSISGFAFRVLPVLVISRLFVGAISEAYAIGSALFYLVCNIVFIRQAGCTRAALSKHLRGAYLVLVLWAGLGLLLRIAATALFTS
jgi:hypothetical protein